MINHQLFMIYSLINVVAYHAEKSASYKHMSRKSLPKLVPTHLLFHNHPRFHVHLSFTITEPAAPSFPITQPDLPFAYISTNQIAGMKVRFFVLNEPI